MSEMSDIFFEIRFQTGEVREVAQAMKEGKIPQLEINYIEEFEIFAEHLKEYGIRKAEEMPYDKTARDGVLEPEFGFRAAFRASEDNKTRPFGLMYIDVYFEDIPEETYDCIGEIMM